MTLDFETYLKSKGLVEEIEYGDPPSKDKASFMLCETCSSKPGIPVLCKSCLHNREVIYRLASRIEDLEYEIENIQEYE